MLQMTKVALMRAEGCLRGDGSHVMQMTEMKLVALMGAQHRRHGGGARRTQAQSLLQCLDDSADPGEHTFLRSGQLRPNSEEGANAGPRGAVETIPDLLRPV
jgi:hypothetical protein